MVLSLIAFTVIEVGFGVSWWIASKTVSGIYYGTKYMIYGPEEKQKEYDPIEFERQILEELKDIKLKVLEKK